jgi:hypothetical protein
MRIDGRPFINYSDLHLRFTEEDLWQLPVRLGQVKNAGQSGLYSAGIQAMLDHADLEKLLKTMRRTEDESKAVYHLRTIVEAKPGTTLSGDEIAQLIEKSKATGRPLAELARELTNVKQVKTIIQPGPAVPNQAGRKKGKTKR